LARGRIWLGRCWAGLPDGLEAGSARPAVVGTMGDGGLDVLRALKRGRCDACDRSVDFNSEDRRLVWIRDRARDHI
jgi:hypothetical protein